MKQKIVIYLATQWIHEWGGGLNWMEQGKFKTLSRLFAPPLLEIEYCSSLRAGPGFVGLFIGQYYWCRLA
jgi:hypothetical protein